MPLLPEEQFFPEALFGRGFGEISADVAAWIAAFTIMLLDLQATRVELATGDALELSLREAMTAYAGSTEQADIGVRRGRGRFPPIHDNIPRQDWNSRQRIGAGPAFSPIYINILVILSPAGTIYGSILRCLAKYAAWKRVDKKCIGALGIAA